MSNNILDEVWDNTVGGLNWLKAVLIGEFSDNRPLSAVAADMLVSFVPGVVIVTSARDAVAVIIRLAHYPDRRQDSLEWILLAACLITLALPLALAAGGLAIAGGGAVISGIAGSELGAVLRAVILMLIKEAAKLSETLKFLQKFMHGDLALFLRSIKFVKYEILLLSAFNKTLNKLLEICRALQDKLKYIAYFDDAKNAIAKLAEWERKFYSLQKEAIIQLPKAVRELDVRLVKLLTDIVPREHHVAVSGLIAPRPAAKALTVQRVRDPVGSHLAEMRSGAGVGSSRNAEAHASAPIGSVESSPAQVKTKPDKVESVSEGHNSKRQDAADRAPETLTASVKGATAQEYGVAFFGQDNKAYYTPANATIGRAGRPFFLMPLEDSGIVKNAGDAARYTGMAPSAQKAYTSGGQIYGLSFPLDGMSVANPTAADAMGWEHFLEGGNTAVKLGGGPTAGYLLNPTREFVVPGGNPVPPGSVLFELGENGEWLPLHRY